MRMRVIQAAPVRRLLERLRPTQSHRSWTIGTAQRTGLALILSLIAVARIDPVWVAAWLAGVVANEYALRPVVFERIIGPLAAVAPHRARILGLAMGLFATCLWATLPAAIWLSGNATDQSIAVIAFASVLLHVVILFGRDRLIIVSPYIILMLSLPFAVSGASWDAALLALGITMFLTSVMISANDHDRLVKMYRSKDIQRKAAERASLQKSQFMATMTHELRTPLNVILGYTEILAEEADAKTSVDLQRIHAAAGHLLRMVNRVLDFAGLDASQVVVARQKIDPIEVAHEVTRRSAVRHAVTLNPNGVTLLLEHGDAMLLGDRARVEQCVQELIDNACRFSQGSEVVVHTTATSTEVVFAVIDKGPGISEDQRARLFQPFGQIDASLTRSSDGLGMGLVLAQKFARLMDGDIIVASQPGRGSTFSLVLPRSQA